jgi:hypothetical protein
VSAIVIWVFCRKVVGLSKSSRDAETYPNFR